MATTQREGKAYAWVTWLTPTLSGQAHCGFASWFKAHFRYEKLDDRSFNLAAWTADHTALIQKRRDELIRDGWKVTLEGENGFRLPGQTAILAGKPDIVARKGKIALVVDVKTGKVRQSDWWQLLVYFVALPRLFEDLADKTMRGEVCYRDQRIAIEPEELTVARREEIYALMRQIGSAERPAKLPSESECRFCDIGPGDCDARFKVEERDVALASEF